MLSFARTGDALQPTFTDTVETLADTHLTRFVAPGNTHVAPAFGIEHAAGSIAKYIANLGNW